MKSFALDAPPAAVSRIVELEGILRQKHLSDYGIYHHMFNFEEWVTHEAACGDSEADEFLGLRGQLTMEKRSIQAARKFEWIQRCDLEGNPHPAGAVSFGVAKGLEPVQDQPESHTTAYDGFLVGFPSEDPGNKYGAFSGPGPIQMEPKNPAIVAVLEEIIALTTNSSLTDRQSVDAINKVAMKAWEAMR